jgi:2-oxoglutarate ferredoxin oxidoreductase subunit delta
MNATIHKTSKQRPAWMNKFKIDQNTPDRIKDWYEQKGREPINLNMAVKPMGHVFIIKDRCKECNYCWNYCPEDVLKISDNLNSKGYHYPTVVDGKICVLCGFCQEICPDFAIFTNLLNEVQSQ